MIEADTSPRVSVAMATYNGARYLAAQLDSIAAQSRPPDELVVHDDGSSDESCALVEDFARRVPFTVRLRRNPERLGYNENFAGAIAACIGDVVFVSDQDDVWHPGKISSALTAFARTPTALCFVNDQALVDADGRSSGATVLGQVRALGYSDAHFGPGCCTAIRRELLDLVLPIPGPPMFYDHWINIVPDVLGARILSEEVLQEYRRHGSNTSASAFVGSHRGIRAVVAMAVAARRNRADAAGDLRDEASRWWMLSEHLRTVEPAIRALGLDHRLPAASRTAEEQRRIFAARAAALTMPPWRRFAAVAMLYAKGDYARLRGWRTAAKDLLG